MEVLVGKTECHGVYDFYYLHKQQEGPAPVCEAAMLGDCDCYGRKTKLNPTS